MSYWDSFWVKTILNGTKFEWTYKFVDGQLIIDNISEEELKIIVKRFVLTGLNSHFCLQASRLW